MFIYDCEFELPGFTHIVNRTNVDATLNSEQILPLVYDELRKLASDRLAHERPGQTLQATALVHEVFVRLVGSSSDQVAWENRGHFFAAAAEAMRRILVENARRKKRMRHGGDLKRVELLDDSLLNVAEPREDLLALDAALIKLKEVHPEAESLVQLRYFGGLTLAQSADSLGIPSRTADRLWAFAKAWLLRELRQNTESPSSN